MNRLDQDIKLMSDAELLAWQHVLPFKGFKIRHCDYHMQEALEDFLTRAFSKQSLKAGVKRLNLRENEEKKDV